jgi:hypothetical protein
MLMIPAPARIRITVTLVLLCAVFALLPARLPAVTPTFPMQVKYSEKLTRKVSFPRDGDTTHVLMRGKGSTLVDVQFSFEGVDLSGLNESAVVFLYARFETLAGEQLQAHQLEFDMDPEYQPGDLEITNVVAQDFLGKLLKTRVISLKIDPVKQVIRMRLRLAAAERILDGLGPDPGGALLALARDPKVGPFALPMQFRVEVFNNSSPLVYSESDGFIAIGSYEDTSVTAPFGGIYDNTSFKAKGTAPAAP